MRLKKLSTWFVLTPAFCLVFFAVIDPVQFLQAFKIVVAEVLVRVQP
nr:MULTISPECIES: hypothetical protein [Agrobacterium]